MADHAIDITGDSDDEEIEVLGVANRTSISTSQPQAIDLTDNANASKRSAVARASISRVPTDPGTPSTNTIIDLLNSSDDDILDLSSRKPPARTLRSTGIRRHGDDQVESPTGRNIQKAANASLKRSPIEQASNTPRKRPYANISASPSALVDLTEEVIENDDRLNPPAQQPPHNSESEQVLTNGQADSSTMPSAPRQTIQANNKNELLPCSVTNGPKLPDVESTATKQSPDDDDDDDDASMEESDTPDSQSSSTSQSEDYMRHHKTARKTISPPSARVTLRPRAAGRAIVERRSALRYQTTLATGSSSSSSSVTPKVMVNDHNHHMEQVDHPITSEDVTVPAKKEESTEPSTKERSDRKSTNTGKQKIGHKPQKTSSRSSIQSAHEKDRDDKKVSFLKQDQSPGQNDDLDSSDDCTTDGDISTSSCPMLNADIDGPIILDLKSLSSRSDYERYDRMDDRIATTTTTHCRVRSSLRMVAAGESRFFAPRYAGKYHDLVQWVTYHEPPLHPQQVPQKHVSLYLPYDAVI